MVSFRKLVLANIVANWILAVIPIAFFVVGILVLVGLGSSDSGPKVPSRSILVVDLSTTFAEGPVFESGAVAEALFGPDAAAINLLDALTALDAAAGDARIEGVLMVGSLFSDGGGSNLAALREVRDALRRIQSAGKTVYAYAEAPSLRDFYLFSLANDLMLNPFGTIDLTGLASSSPYLAKALDKFGVGTQVVKVGDYKSATEIFTRSSMSPEDRVQLQGLLNEVWGDLLSGYAEHRRLDPIMVRRLSETRGFMEAEEALNVGLVDRLGYLGDLIATLEDRVGRDDTTGTFPQISLKDYHAAEFPRKMPFSDASRRLAVVYFNGVIVDGEGSLDDVGGDWYARELRALRFDESVKAVVIRVNSPGGSAFASEVLRDEIARLAEQVPVIVSMGGTAASGGYWVATAADTVLAQPTTLTGSIGVFGVFFNLKEMASKQGVYFDGVSTGPFAGLGTVTRPLNDRELTRLQESVDGTYERFIDLVARGREMTPEAVEAIAGGRVWTGQQALRLGLVDRLGGLQDAIDLAAERAGLTRRSGGERDYDIVQVPHIPEFLEQILSALEGSSGSPPVAELARWASGLPAGSQTAGGRGRGPTAGHARPDARTVNWLNRLSGAGLGSGVLGAVGSQGSSVSAQGSGRTTALGAIQSEFFRVSSLMGQFNDPRFLYARTPLWVTVP